MNTQLMVIAYINNPNWRLVVGIVVALLILVAFVLVFSALVAAAQENRRQEMWEDDCDPD